MLRGPYCATPLEIFSSGNSLTIWRVGLAPVTAWMCPGTLPAKYTRISPIEVTSSESLHGAPVANEFGGNPPHAGVSLGSLRQLPQLDVAHGGAGHHRAVSHANADIAATGLGGNRSAHLAQIDVAAGRTHQQRAGTADDFDVSAARLHPGPGNRLQPDISAQGNNLQIAHRGIDANVAAAGANKRIAQTVIHRYRAAHGHGAQQLRIVDLNVAAMGLEVEWFTLPWMVILPARVSTCTFSIPDGS